nr:patatin-like phospholipase family protein [uncultured Methylophaga sp.]
MTYKVAIAISGGVSLGAYEAGTMYEIVNAIKLHNEINPVDEHIKIDVLTGASAGGLTALMYAQSLLYNSASLEYSENNNIGYMAWVEEVDISGLLTPHKGDDFKTSLLSNGFVEVVAENILLHRYKQDAVPLITKHIASDEQIQLGLAMSNLNGFDFSRDIFSSTHGGLQTTKFVETRHQDRMFKTLTSADDNLETWYPLSVAARSCGAFPFAFSPISIKRNFEPDYGEWGADQFPNESANFTYTDGGVFNNYPLGMARKLVKNVDNDPLDYEKRFYFYISPGARTSQQDLKFGTEETLDIKKFIWRLVNTIFYQARFQDWLLTDEYNKEIELLDNRAEELAEYVKNLSMEELSKISGVARNLCEKVYGYHKSDDPQQKNTDESLNDALIRLEKQYKDNKDSDCFMFLFESELPVRQAWLYSIALLEKVAGLNDRDTMNVYTITSEDDELAGEELMAFLGFLDERFRRYDYLRGRLNASKAIKNILNSNAEGKIGQLPLNIPEPETETLEQTLEDMKLNKATISDVSFKIRKKLRKRITDRYYDYISYLSPIKLWGWRWGARMTTSSLGFLLYWGIVRSKINDLLKL